VYLHCLTGLSTGEGFFFPRDKDDKTSINEATT
jgi:hypothetical protein